MRPADPLRQPHPLKLAQTPHSDRLVEGVAPRGADEHVRIRFAQQRPIDTGQPFLLDFGAQPCPDRVGGARAKIEVDQFGGALSHTLGHIFAGDDQILVAIVLPPHDDTAVRVAGVEVIDRDPIQPGAEILFHSLHQPSRQRLQIIIFGAILRRDDETELVAIARLPIEKSHPVDLIRLGPVELSSSTIAGRAVTLDIAEMGARRRPALACQFDDAGFGDDPALAKGPIDIAAGEHAANARATSDPTAVETVTPSARRAASLCEICRGEDAMKELPALPLPAGSHTPQSRLEFVVVTHGRLTRNPSERQCARHRRPGKPVPNFVRIGAALRHAWHHLHQRGAGNRASDSRITMCRQPLMVPARRVGTIASSCLTRPHPLPSSQGTEKETAPSRAPSPRPCRVMHRQEPIARPPRQPGRAVRSCRARPHRHRRSSSRRTICRSKTR